MSLVRKLLSLNLEKNIAKITTTKLSTSTFIQNSGLPDVEIPKVTVQEYVYSHAEKYGQLTAFECGITGRKYSYSELLQKSANFGKSLRKRLNLKKGDVIGIFLPNVPEFPLAVLGALNAGLVVTTLNPVYTQEEISRQLTDSSAKAVITLNQLWDVTSAALKLLQKTLPVITIKTEQTEPLHRGAISFAELTDPIDYPSLPPGSHEDIALLPYSSGTTGLPKGVQLSHYNIVANTNQNSSPDLPLLETSDGTNQDVVPAILPMFHIYGLTVNTIWAITKGTKNITLPKFTPETYVNVLRTHKANVLFVVPPIVLFMTAHPMVKTSDLESVRSTMCGAAPLGGLDEVRFKEKAGKDINMLQGYGLTETSPTVTVTSIALKSEKDCAGSIGRAVPNTLLKVIDLDDPTGVPLGPNVQGELLIKGPQVMKSYLNKPEATEKTFLDGWLRTGDMVYYNQDGIFFVTDRLKELIKVKGFQVPPAELEEIIRNFPDVEDAAVIGIPHATQGEAPRAYVVPKKNAVVDIAKLSEYVASQVAEYKRLKGGVELIDAIPKTASGKILRRNLKLHYEKSSSNK